MAGLTGAAQQDEPTIIPHPLHRHTEGMNRPALLKKRSTTNNLCHRRSPSERQNTSMADRSLPGLGEPHSTPSIVIRQTK
jgi:hypothetical protein